MISDHRPQDIFRYKIQGTRYKKAFLLSLSPCPLSLVFQVLQHLKHLIKSVKAQAGSGNTVEPKCQHV